MQIFNGFEERSDVRLWDIVLNRSSEKIKLNFRLLCGLIRH